MATTIDFINKSATQAAQDINTNFSQGGGSGSGITLPYNLVVLGDSIATEGSGHWFNAMKTKFGISSAYNLAVSGAKWRHSDGSKYLLSPASNSGDDNIVTNQVYTLIERCSRQEGASGYIPTPDIVLIHCGTNDGPTSLGTPADVFNYSTTSSSAYLANWDVENETYTNTAMMKTTSGGIRFALDLLRTNFPYARIILTTPIYTANQSQQSHIRQEGACIKDCGSYMAYPVIDLGYESGIFVANAGLYLNQDGLHPNYRGGKVLADIIGSRLCAMFGFKPMFDYSTNEAPTL